MAFCAARTCKWQLPQAGQGSNLPPSEAQMIECGPHRWRHSSVLRQAQATRLVLNCCEKPEWSLRALYPSLRNKVSGTLEFSETHNTFGGQAECRHGTAALMTRRRRPLSSPCAMLKEAELAEIARSKSDVSATLRCINCRFRSQL